MQFPLKVPDVHAAAGKAAAKYTRDLRRATVIALDRAGQQAQAALRERMRSANLGRLPNAVGFTSTKRQKGDDGSDPYAVIYARGGDQSLAGGALEAYSRGATIRADQKQWLAFQTGAIPRRIGRRRTTPALYNASGLTSTIGKLIFRPLGPDRAVLVIQNVSLSPKNGRAKALGKRRPRTRIPQKEIVAFILIRVTTRAQRFDKDAVIFPFSQRVADFIQEELDRMAA